MKKLLLCLTMLLSLTTYSQLTFRVTEWVSDDENPETFQTNEYFMLSISDGYLVHLVLADDGTYQDSQFYKVTSSSYNETSGITTFDAESGVSGNVYTYKMIVKDNIIYVSKSSSGISQYASSDDGGKLKTFNKY